MHRTRLPGTPEPDRFVDGAVSNPLAVDCWGEETQQSVILLHGGGQTRHAWKGTGQVLADAGYFTMAFDARGHGDSEWVAQAQYDSEHMADDLAALIDTYQLNKPVLVGASMGGMTALAALGDNKVDAGGLVLVDIGPTIEEAGANRVLEFMRQKVDGFNSLEEVAEAIGSYQPQRNKPRKLDGLAKNIRLGEDGRYYWHWDPAYIGGARDIGAIQEKMKASARKLTIPSLMVRGGLSDVLSEEGAQEFLQLCPHAEYENVGEATHMVAGDRNDLFTAAVAKFLQRHFSTS
jgi:pimeloyl-ACP methyl ester carboxylesterase